MKKFKVVWIQDIKDWFNSLTAKVEKREDGSYKLIYSLSDSSIFFSLIVFLPLWSLATYSVFFLGIGTWKEYLVLNISGLLIMAFKIFKYVEASNQYIKLKFGNEENKKEGD